MSLLKKLNFPPCPMRISRREGIDHVWDPIRRRWLQLTPEEWVRRHLIGWLCDVHCVNPATIAQEYPVELSGCPQRADVVVLDGDRPLLLAECKAPEIPIDASTLAQAVRYNSVLGARYIILTNGLTHHIYKKEDGGDYTPVDLFSALFV